MGAGGALGAIRVAAGVADGGAFGETGGAFPEAVGTFNLRVT